MQEHQLDSSYRDPSGYMFRKDGIVYRRINLTYFESFQKLLSSGLYQKLVENHYLVSHEEIDRNAEYLVIKPQQLPLITYPYEWSFSQLKAAAVLTLKIQCLALEYGMSLKDAQGTNIQFIGHRPIFIDTLSFEPYPDNLPWKAYGQFCRHFVAPLLLMKYVDLRCSHLLNNFLDGIPLDLASRMLPRKTHWSLFVKLHLHLHARYVVQNDQKSGSKGQQARMALSRLQAMLQSLQRNLEKLEYAQATEWGDYYEKTLNYSPESLKEKQQIIREYLNAIRPDVVWDVGSNDGKFSRLAADTCGCVLSTDIDLQAVDQNYRFGAKNKEKNVFPLFFDVTNPTPDLGLHGGQHSLERRLMSMGVDCIFALALIHHLSITNNYPFEFIARFFARIAPYLVIEFVKPSDSWASALLARKQDAQDLFSYYNQEDFEAVFGRWYSIKEQQDITGADRVIYLMKRKS